MSPVDPSLCKPCPRGTTSEGRAHGYACTPCPPSSWPYDPQFITAVNTTTALLCHVATTLDQASWGKTSDVCVDAVVYFERVWAIDNSVIEVTCFFKFLTPNLADPRDIISVWVSSSPPMESQCMSAQSLHLGMPLKSSRQLAWAYTSARTDTYEISAHRQVGAAPREKDSFVFRFESAGTGPYVLTLFSHKLQRMVAQIEYAPTRAGDCKPLAQEIFLCDFPEDKGSQAFGPLMPCPLGYLTDYTTYSGCRGCRPGTYAENRTMCAMCPVGKYSKDVGASTCVSCGVINTTLSTGTASVNECINCFTLARTLQVPYETIAGCENAMQIVTTQALVTTTPMQTRGPMTTPVPVAEACGDGVRSLSEVCDPGPVGAGRTPVILSPAALSALGETTSIRCVFVCCWCMYGVMSACEWLYKRC